MQDPRKAIREHKARIEEIDIRLAQPIQPGTEPRFRRRLIEQRLQLEEAVADIERVHRPPESRSGKVASPGAAAERKRRKPDIRREELSNADVLGRRRARLVARLIQELNALRPHMQVPDEDYPKLRKENPSYAVFKICYEHPSAIKFVKWICDRRHVHSLAYEIAAVKLGVSPATIKSAWKKYKPKAGHRKKH